MKKPLFWIIDEEWPDYDLEVKLLREKYPHCDIRFSTYEYEKDLEDFGRSADAILCQIYARLPGPVIEKLDNCKAIAVYGGGYDRVDVEAARRKGIKVTNVSNYCKEDLADYTLAAVYYFNKQLARLSAEVKSLPWGAQAIKEAPVRLSHSVMHIIGFGRIGQAVAAKALGNGLTVTAFDDKLSAQEMEQCGVKKIGWAEGLAGADYVSLNCILNDETRHLVKYEDLAKMKRTAYLINTARGAVIDEAALVRALNEGLIKGAMLDVITTEPPEYTEEIFNCPAAHITPHVSYISVQSFEELKRRAVNNACIGLEGGLSPDLVNG